MMQRRLAAALAGVLLALGSASAQAPQPCPAPSPTYPPPSSAYWAPTGNDGYATIQPGCTFSVVKESNTAELLIVGNDGLRSSCKKTTLLINGTASVAIRPDAEGKQVLVGNDTDGNIKGSADRVSRGGTDGATLTLEGKAQLRCSRNGRQAEMTGDRIVVNLLTGHVEVELGAQPPGTVPPPPPPPVTPVKASCAPLSSAPRSVGSLSLAELARSIGIGY